MEEKWKPHPTRENIFKVGGCMDCEELVRKN